MHVTEHLNKRTKPLVSLEITPPEKGSIIRRHLFYVVTIQVLLLAFVSTAFAQSDSADVTHVSQTTISQPKEKPFPFPGTLFWKSGAAINRYVNIKTCQTIEHSVFETNLFSIATITSKDRKTRLSSNYPIVIMPLTFFALGMGDQDLVFASLLPEMIGNGKVYFPIITDHVRIGGGMNTDYYFFYKNSVIYSEAILGVKIKTKNLRLYCEYRYPLNSSYLDNNEPYVGVNIGIFNWENK